MEPSSNSNSERARISRERIQRQRTLESDAPGTTKKPDVLSGAIPTKVAVPIVLVIIAVVGFLIYVLFTNQYDLPR